MQLVSNQSSSYTMITEEELLKMIARCRNAQERGLIIIMANTGLRISEICGLNVSDVLNEDGTFRETIRIRPEISKGYKTAEIPLLEETIEAFKKVFEWNLEHNFQGCPGKILCATLKRYYTYGCEEKKCKGPIFWTSHKNVFYSEPHRMGTDTIQRLIKRIRPDKRIHAHLLRHRFGRQVYKSTGDIELTRNVMRHSNLNVTQIYISPSREELISEFQDKMKRIFPIKTEFAHDGAMTF